MRLGIKKENIYKDCGLLGSIGFVGIVCVWLMLEKNIVNAILKYLRTLPSCFCFKEHGGMYGTAGVPDIICCYKGRFLAFEVKTEVGKTTKLQEVTIDRINCSGGIAVVVRSVDEVKTIIDKMGGAK